MIPSNDMDLHKVVWIGACKAMNRYTQSCLDIHVTPTLFLPFPSTLRREDGLQTRLKNQLKVVKRIPPHLIYYLKEVADELGANLLVKRLSTTRRSFIFCP